MALRSAARRCAGPCCASIRGPRAERRTPPAPPPSAERTPSCPPSAVSEPRFRGRRPTVRVSANGCPTAPPTPRPSRRSCPSGRSSGAALVLVGGGCALMFYICIYPTIHPPHPFFPFCERLSAETCDLFIGAAVFLFFGAAVRFRSSRCLSLGAVCRRFAALVREWLSVSPCERRGAASTIGVRGDGEPGHAVQKAEEQLRGSPRQHQPERRRVASRLRARRWGCGRD